MNVTASEVRYALGLNETQWSDTLLASAAYIPLSDAWVNSILAKSSLTFASLTANQQALIKGAECYHVGLKVISLASKEDFSIGPIKSARVKADEIAKLASEYRKNIKQCFSAAGIKLNDYAAYINVGSDYSPTGRNDTNVDLGLALSDGNYPFNSLGVDLE